MFFLFEDPRSTVLTCQIQLFQSQFLSFLNVQGVLEVSLSLTFYRVPRDVALTSPHKVRSREPWSPSGR